MKRLEGGRRDSEQGPICFLTRDFHFQKWENFHQEYGDPAEGVREHDEEKPVGHGHVSVQPAPHVGGVQARFIDGAKHAGVGEDDHQERHQVQT